VGTTSKPPPTSLFSVSRVEEAIHFILLGKSFCPFVKGTLTLSSAIWYCTFEQCPSWTPGHIARCASRFMILKLSEEVTARTHDFGQRIPCNSPGKLTESEKCERLSECNAGLGSVLSRATFTPLLTRPGPTLSIRSQTLFPAPLLIAHCYSYNLIQSHTISSSVQCTVYLELGNPGNPGNPGNHRRRGNSGAVLVWRSRNSEMIAEDLGQD
jgi:hypothetical protein